MRIILKFMLHCALGRLNATRQSVASNGQTFRQVLVLELGPASGFAAENLVPVQGEGGW